MKPNSASKLLILLIMATIVGLAGCGTRDTEITDPVDPGISSPDWRLVGSGLSNTVRAMATNDTMVVAVGDGGIIYSSTDGHAWTAQRENGPNDGLSDIAWTGDRFIAVGHNATLISSPDGITWTFEGVDPYSNLTGIAVGDTILLGVGNSGTTGRVYYSRHGDEWFEQDSTSIAGNVYDVMFANGAWLIGAVGGQCYISEDALTWVPASFPIDERTECLALSASDSMFYSLMREYIDGGSPSQYFRAYSSSDGDNWFSLGTIDAFNLWDIHWTCSELVAVGEGNNYHLGLPDGLVFSSNGTTGFAEQTTEAPFSLTCAETFGDQLLIGGGSGYILGGPNSGDLSVKTSGASITGVVWTGTEYVAVTERGTILRSTDGESWTETHSHSSTNFEFLAFSGSAYVSLGGFAGPGASTEIYTSFDGDTWARTKEFSSVVLRDVIYADGRFLVCGQNGTIFLSTDGQAWDSHTVGESVDLKSLCYDGSRYLAAASNIVYTSTNGIDWSKPTIDPTDPEPLIERLIWTGSQYVTLAERYESDGGGYQLRASVYMSPDAVHWTAHQFDIDYSLTDIAWTGSHLVACGLNGTLFTSPTGQVWDQVLTGTEHHLTEIEVRGGQTLVVGANRTVLVSP